MSGSAPCVAASAISVCECDDGYKAGISRMEKEHYRNASLFTIKP